MCDHSCWHGHRLCLGGRGKLGGPVEELEVLDGDLAVEHGGVEPGLAGGQDDHEVGVGGELHDEEAEAEAGLVLHADELLGVAGGAGEAGDALLEVLHDVGHALEAVLGGVVAALGGGPGGDGEEGGALEEEDLLGLDGEPEVLEVALDDAEVGDEVVDDGGPGLVEGLVPDAGGEGYHVDAAAPSNPSAAANPAFAFADDADADAGGELARLLADEADAVVVHGLAAGGHDEVHLVDEDVDAGGGAELQQGGEDGDVGGEVAVDVARLDVEDVDEDADVGEDVDALLGEVVLHEGLLAAAVPEVERQVAEEFHVREVDVDGGSSIG